MNATTFWKQVTMDRAGFLESIISILQETEVDYCVIGGQAVNAYATPLVSLDLDLVVSIRDMEKFKSALSESYRIERFPHSLNVTAPGSELRLQIQTDERYFDFPARAMMMDVLGVPLRVASMHDVLRGKVWAASDPERSPSKRRKDLLDIERLVEAHPELHALVPAEIRSRLDLP